MRTKASLLVRTLAPLVVLAALARPAAADSLACHPIALAARGSTPVGTGSCPGVRPGGLVQTSVGSCTLNFLFRGSDGIRYVGTAGHCILGNGVLQEDVGERKWRAGAGPIARDSNGRRIGRFVYAILKDPKDFALVRLDPSVAASPRICFFGGPTAYSTATATPAQVHYYGVGAGIGDLVPARTALATSLSSPDHVYALGVITPGDSGAPMIDDAGRALAVVVTLGAHAGNGITDVGSIGATRLAPQVARAAKVLRISLRLLTASY